MSKVFNIGQTFYITKQYGKTFFYKNYHKTVMKQYESEDEDYWYLLLLMSGAKQRKLEKRGRILSRKQAQQAQKELAD